MRIQFTLKEVKEILRKEMIAKGTIPESTLVQASIVIDGEEHEVNYETHVLQLSFDVPE